MYDYHAHKNEKLLTRVGIAVIVAVFLIILFH